MGVSRNAPTMRVGRQLRVTIPQWPPV